MNTLPFPLHLTLADVPTGAQVFPLMELVRTHRGGVVHICLDDIHREQLEASIRFFAPEVQVLTFPAWDTVPYDRVSPAAHLISKRLFALGQMVSWVDGVPPSPTIILTTVNAITQRIIPRDVLQQHVMLLQVGHAIPRDVLSRFLVDNGYIHSAVANEAGEFSVRGSMVDIVPAGSAHGYRLDFFGDELETIRQFDCATQISSGKQTSLHLLPVQEVLLSEKTITTFRHRYRKLFASSKMADPLYDAITEGRRYAGMEQFLPLFYEQLETLFDYVPQAILTEDHMVEEARAERSTMIAEHYQHRVEFNNDASGDELRYHPLPPEQLHLLPEAWQQRTSNIPQRRFHPYSLPASADVKAMGYRQGEDYSVMAKHQHQPALEILKTRLATQRIPLLIACMSEGSRTRIAAMCEEYDIPTRLADDARNLDIKTVTLVILPLDTGFTTDALTIVTEQDLLGEKIFRLAKKARKAEQFLMELSALQPGDVVVHREHGIGRFVGLETLTVAGQAHDLIKLLYAGDDKLFVPVENMEVISRYGSNAEEVVLDRLGGEAWQRRTAALKKRIRYAAEELLKVAAERELHQAPVFHKTAAYEAFCARFPYPETEDQLQSIEDVLEDLSTGKPMDRLVCGDVGFGKTEVALRAAFIAATPDATHSQPRGQVAVICPTTLLARQHYQNFAQRFRDLGFNVKHLSRFVAVKEEKQTKAGLEDGSVDIVIGTHALLSQDIQFKNLTLLIVDEEQRFGVSQKERLKKLRTTTHVLTLTATPIPRTLQLSLSGIRELSLITTPPVDRLAVRTYVLPYDPVVLREAILREHYRGGRTFYVCPRIADVEELEPKLKQLVPEVKIVSAHGRMTGDKLDSIMNQFYDGHYDVLLSTTIVESGLDVPTANTLIVHRADMYGLAQLYQIRGRVGRSKVRAYAYLTLPPHKILTETAQKRLDVMQKLDSLGAGFMLATHDMDIRGFGNLLGDEQSGTIKEVGVELYQAMLREAVDDARARARNEAKIEDRFGFSPKINIGTSVLIPETYVQDLGLRMALYKRIADLVKEEDIHHIQVELVDRFGAIPESVQHLLEVVRIKQLCLQCGIEKLDVGAKGALVSFYKDQFAQPEKLLAHLSKHPQHFRIKDGSKLSIVNQAWEKIPARISGVQQQLIQLNQLCA